MTGTENILLLTDSYKVSHYKQYPPGTTKVYSYFESRGGMFPETVFFGLQYQIKRYLQGQVITQAKIDEADAFYKKHFGMELFNKAGWESLLQKHGGILPVTIRAVPEGSVVGTKNVLFTIENTDPEFFWVTNYLETLLVQVWYPTTVATLSREMKKLILDGLTETGDPNLIGFKLHDFGFRGVSSVESAGIGGAAHLINFLGSDTVAGIVVAREYYGEDMAGFSIPAAEHSTITSWGRDNESKAYENMLTQFGGGLVACVSDSYDIYNAVMGIWGHELKDKVLNMGGTLVVRPDSGNPVDMVVDVLSMLGETFGYTTNSKGYKVLNPKVRMIHGDGITYESMKQILTAMKEAGWSVDNAAFGMGGGLLQMVNRDTNRFALKCSSVVVNGEARDVFKQPVDDNTKASKRGRFDVIKTPTKGFITVMEGEQFSYPSQLIEVFRDGKLLVDQTFAYVRARAAIVPKTLYSVSNQ